MKKLLMLAIVMALLILTVVPAFADVVGQCPAEFLNFMAAPDDPENRNGDGVVCVKFVGNQDRGLIEIRVDNNIPLD